MRWDGHNRWNLKLAKGFKTLGGRTELALEVRNLFNNKDLIMLEDEDLINYHEKGQLPNHWLSGEPDEWAWYDVWANPPRQAYLQLRIDF
jgi:hypothetical protein